MMHTVNGRCPKRFFSRSTNPKLQYHSFKTACSSMIPIETVLPPLFLMKSNAY